MRTARQIKSNNHSQTTVITPYKLIEIIKEELGNDLKFVNELFEQTPDSAKKLEENSTFKSLMLDLVSNNQFIFSGKLRSISPNLEIFLLLRLANDIFSKWNLKQNMINKEGLEFIKREILHILEVNEPNSGRINERTIVRVNDFLFEELERNQTWAKGVPPFFSKVKIPLAFQAYPELKKHYFPATFGEENGSRFMPR